VHGIDTGRKKNLCSAIRIVCAKGAGFGQRRLHGFGLIVCSDAECSEGTHVVIAGDELACSQSAWTLALACAVLSWGGLFVWPAIAVCGKPSVAIRIGRGRIKRFMLTYDTRTEVAAAAGSRQSPALAANCKAPSFQL